MPQRDFHSNHKSVGLIDPIVGNNDTEGTPSAGLDTRGFDGAELYAYIGASGDTIASGKSIKVTLQESDDGSAWTAVTDANDVNIGSADSLVAAPDSSGVIAVVDGAADDEKLLRVGYRGSKRYCRLFFNFFGTHTNGTPIASWGLLGYPRGTPLSD